MLDHLWQDLRYGARRLSRRPGFALTVIAMLALGIGAATTIFGVVKSVVLERLRYQQPNRLVRLWQTNAKDSADFPVSAPNYKDWRSQQHSFQDLAAVEAATFNVTDGGDPERLSATRITGNLLSTLGVKPILGRGFLDDEETMGRNRVALLSHALWLRRFGGESSAINQTIRLDGVAYTIVGVMPPRFEFPEKRELWVPLVLDPAAEPWRADRSNRNLAVFGRLAPDVTLEQATTDMNVIAQRIEQQQGQSNRGWGVRLRTFPEWIVPSEVRRSLVMLFIAVGLLLLIVCANVANLLLARTRAHEQEITIRSALGASRSRLTRQILLESLMLALLGGGLGVLLTFAATKLIAASGLQNVTRLAESRVDWQMLLFALAVSSITALIFGTAPAWSATDVSVSERTTSSGRVTQRLRGTLVVAEVMLALALLITAALVMRSFVRLQSMPLGFNPDNVLTMQISLPGSKYGQQSQRVAFYRQLLDRLRGTPGVVNAAAITQPPLSPGTWSVEIEVEGGGATGGPGSPAEVRAATPAYFATMGIPILRGRDFDEGDGNYQNLGVVVSSAFARRYWPDEDPVGKRFRTGPNNPISTVIGVAGDVSTKMAEPPQPTFYYPYSYIGMQALFLVVKTSGDPQNALPAVQAQVQQIDREQPVYNVRALDEIVVGSTADTRMRTALLTLFGCVAALFAAFGVYSVMSYMVRQRRQEIGIRMALGARARDVMAMVVGQGMQHVGIGVVLGVLVSLASTRLMQSLLFEVSATDPLIFVAMASLVALIGLAACLLPASQVTRIDPWFVLRQD